MRMQKKATAATEGTTTMVTPRPMDVRLGRGKSFSIHLGNNILHELVSSYRLEYMSSLNLRKREITTDIVNTIHTNGGRFIKQCEDDKEMWLIVSTETARQKVAHAMQYLIRTVQNSPDEQLQQQPTSTLTAAKETSTSGLNEQPSPLASFAPEKDIDRYGESVVDVNSFKSMIVSPTDGFDSNLHPHCHHCSQPTLLLHQQFSSTVNRPLQYDSVQPFDASLLSLYKLRAIAAAQRIDRCPQQQEHEQKLLYMQHPLSRIYRHPYGHDRQRLPQQNHDQFSYISNSNYVNESNQFIECTEKINDIPLDSLFDPTNADSISIHEVAPKFLRNYTVGNECIPSQIDSFVAVKSSNFESAGRNTHEYDIFHTGFVKSPPVPITFQANRSNKKLATTSSCGDMLEQSMDDECCNASIHSALSFDALDLSGIGSLNEYDFTAPVGECANKSVCLQ